MRKTRKQNRGLVLALCLCLLASVFPLSGMTYAAGTGCTHQHDDTCGYIEAVEGQPCAFTHAHDDTCGYAEAKEAVPCTVEAAHTHDESCGYDPETGEGCTFAHPHDENCGYAEAKEASPCSVEAGHIHDDTCGYIEAVAGAPCTHVHDESCGGLMPDSSPVPCTLTEGCKLPAGHEGECELPMALGASPRDSSLVTGEGYTFDLDSGRLTVSTNEGTNNWKNDKNIPEPPNKPRQESIKSLEIQEGVTSIDSYAFMNCNQIQKVLFPEGLIEIGDQAFSYCTMLNEVVFSEGLTTIGEQAFKSCDLRSVSFPKSLQSIGDEAFKSCGRLKDLTFLGDQPPANIGYDAFNRILNSGGTVYYPEGAGEHYTETWKTRALGLDGRWQLAVLDIVFVPVIDITLSSACAVPLNTSLALTATVEPSDASCRSIVWSVKDANGTGAKITGGNLFRATAGGAATVLATVKNGAVSTDGAPVDFTKEFIIDVVAAKEQFSLATGHTYYFDLSGVAFPGEVHDGDTGNGDALPDKSLRYMPFTYAGTVSAYALPESMNATVSTAENTAQYVYDHSLFIADYSLVIKKSGDEWPVSWNMLKDAGLIFGTPYSDRGIDYTLRAPTTGGGSINDNTNEERGVPENNEWDAILNKCGQYYTDNVSGYIKNWVYRFSWGQDTGFSEYASSNIRWARGASTARYSGLSGPDNQLSIYNYRPVLEIPGTQDGAGLRTMALNLNDGRLRTDVEYQGNPIEDLNFVYAGESFIAPDGSDYVRPSQEAGTYLRWKDSKENLYNPGERVPSSVTELKAIWSPPVSISKIDGVTVPVRGEAPVTEIQETEQFTGTMAWSPDPGAVFAGDTEYTAVITLTPKTGYSLKDIVADFFNVEGAVATNDAGSGVVSAKFPRTAPDPTYWLTIQAGTGGKITQGASDRYVQGATITLKAEADTGYTFDGWTTSNGGSFADKNSAATTFTMPANDVTVTATYHTHKYEGVWQHDNTDHWQLCSCGEAGPKTPHSGGTANCHEKAVCEVCKATYGSLNPDNHDGDTELRNAKAATEEAEGYTGDTYCLGCGELIAKGKVISKTTIPQTGDDTLLWPWLALMLVSLSGCCGLLIYRKHSYKRRRG